MRENIFRPTLETFQKPPLYSSSKIDRKINTNKTHRNYKDIMGKLYLNTGARNNIMRTVHFVLHANILHPLYFFETSCLDSRAYIYSFTRGRVVKNNVYIYIANSMNIAVHQSCTNYTPWYKAQLLTPFRVIEKTYTRALEKKFLRHWIFFFLRFYVIRGNEIVAIVRIAFLHYPAKRRHKKNLKCITRSIKINRNVWIFHGFLYLDVRYFNGQTNNVIYTIPNINSFDGALTVFSHSENEIKTHVPM